MDFCIHELVCLWNIMDSYGFEAKALHEDLGTIFSFPMLVNP